MEEENESPPPSGNDSNKCVASDQVSFFLVAALRPVCLPHPSPPLVPLVSVGKFFAPRNEKTQQQQKKTYYYVDTSSYGRTAKLLLHSAREQGYMGSRHPDQAVSQPATMRYTERSLEGVFPFHSFFHFGRWYGGASPSPLYSSPLLVNPATKKVL